MNDLHKQLEQAGLREELSALFKKHKKLIEEAGLILANPNVPEETKAKVRKILEEL